MIKGPLTVELGVFVDDAMWQHFNGIYGSKADSELLSFILAAVNNVSLELAKDRLTQRLASNDSCHSSLQFDINLRKNVTQFPTQIYIRVSIVATWQLS